MANTKLVFYGSEQSNTESKELECFHNKWNEITIIIEDSDVDHDCNFQFVSLNKSTAIKLSKVLRATIAEIREEEHNG